MTRPARDWAAEAADAARQASLEEEATALLRKAGGFRRGTGIKSPKSDLETTLGFVRWEDWMTKRIVEFYRHPCEDLDTLAVALRLTPEQKAVLRRRRI